jgi:hypothetical protein
LAHSLRLDDVVAAVNLCQMLTLTST